MLLKTRMILLTSVKGVHLYAIKRISPSNSPSSQFNNKIKILISEDVLYNQTLLHNMVTSLGYSDIAVASDGQETIEKLDFAYEDKQPFDALLLDLRMPKMDGYDVIEHIRSKGYPLQKIVAVTASVLAEKWVFSTSSLNQSICLN